MERQTAEAIMDLWNDESAPYAYRLRKVAELAREIALAESEADHLEATPRDSREFRLNDMRAASRRSTNIERRQFIAKLQAILDYRASKPVSRQE